MMLREKEQLIAIPGPQGTLEAILTPQENSPSHRFAIICHPHPLHGGTFQNKVVTTLAQALHQLGMPAIRFNFRGVGQSAGQYDNGVGEQEDLLAVINWVIQHNPETKIFLAGFSFGAYISLAVANHRTQQLSIVQLVTVAPPINHFPVANKIKVDCPWLLIQGEADDVVDPKLVFAWAGNLVPEPKIIRFPKVGHFFHGNLVLLKEAVIANVLS